jgi:hypothetical protein
MPFADVSRCVAGILQDFRQSDFALKEMGILRFVKNPAIDPGSNMMATG